MDPNLFCLSASISACETWQKKKPEKAVMLPTRTRWVIQAVMSFFYPQSVGGHLTYLSKRSRFHHPKKVRKNCQVDFCVIFGLQVPNVRGLYTIISQSNLLRQQVTKCEMFCKKHVFWKKSKWRYAGIPEHVVFFISQLLYIPDACVEALPTSTSNKNSS